MIARPRQDGGDGAASKPGPIRCAVYCRKSVDKGNGGEFGLTHNVSGEHNVSFGAGFVAKNITDVDDFSETVDLVNSAGLFYDRGGSLMTGILFSPDKDSRWRLNVYPGLLRLGPLRPGFTVIMAKNSDVLAGVTLGNFPLVPTGLSRRFED